jgi:hypothetical protein
MSSGGGSGGSGSSGGTRNTPPPGGGPSGDTGVAPLPPGPATEADRGTGVSLGAALLSLSFEEGRPQLGGGLSLYARQQRELDRVKNRVSKLEQES